MIPLSSMHTYKFEYTIHPTNSRSPHKFKARHIASSKPEQAPPIPFLSLQIKSFLTFSPLQHSPDSPFPAKNAPHPTPTSSIHNPTFSPLSPSRTSTFRSKASRKRRPTRSSRATQFRPSNVGKRLQDSSLSTRKCRNPPPAEITQT